jgi:hypothetical protein
MEKNHGKIGWGRWIALAAVPTLVIMVVTTGLVMLKGHFGWY